MNLMTHVHAPFPGPRARYTDIFVCLLPWVRGGQPTVHVHIKYCSALSSFLGEVMADDLCRQ